MKEVPEGRKKNINSRKKQNEMELRMGKFYMILGSLVVGMGAFIILGIIFKESDRPGAYPMCFIIFVSVLVFGVPMVLTYLNHKVNYNNEKIIVSDWLRRTKEIKWSEIEDVDFSPTSDCIIISGEGKRIKIHYPMIGINDFLFKIRRNTPSSISI